MDCGPERLRCCGPGPRLAPGLPGFLASRAGRERCTCSPVFSGPKPERFKLIGVLRREKKVLSPTVSWSADDSAFSPRLLLWRTKPLTYPSGLLVWGGEYSEEGIAVLQDRMNMEK